MGRGNAIRAPGGEERLGITYVQLATKLMDPARGHPDTVWDRFAPPPPPLCEWVPTLGVVDAATHHSEAPGLKPGSEKRTTAITYHQILGHEPESAPELRTKRICEVLACLIYGDRGVVIL